MGSSRTITLFSQGVDISQGPTSFAASFLFHCLAISLLSFGVIYTPRLDTRAAAERFNVRRLDLQTPEEQQRRAARSKVKYPGPKPKVVTAKAGGKPVPHPPVLRQVAQAQKGPQTLVQPDLHSELTLAKEVPVPSLVIWSPQNAPVKTIVAPLPEKATASDVKPSPDPPNEQVDLANISIATPSVAKPKLIMPASTTSPVAVDAPDKVQLAPTSVSQPSAQPTPVAVMSLSDLRMAQGTVVLPPVNESADSNAQGTLAPGAATSPSEKGSGDQAGNGGTGQGATGTANPAAQSAATTKPSGSDSVPAHGSDTSDGQSDQPTATHITLPKEGQFGAVVIGDSLQDEFPEMTQVWGGRLAYTVYLHVGLARSWILQYSLPRSDDAAMAGNVVRLAAPWPYNIVRPNLVPGSVDVNTIMVHGFVNQSGRFETLNVVFPPEFPQSQFVITSLQQWQFRPAMQNGQIARVEVLLIIPQAME